LRLFLFLLIFWLDSYFARADTANPDSGDVHSPNAPPSRRFTARLVLDETKPGSKLKTDAKSICAPHRRAVPAQWLLPF